MVTAVDYSTFRASNDALEDTSELKQRLQEDGYLFFRRLVPPDAVLTVRRDTLDLCRDAGWICPHEDPLEAEVVPGMEPTTEGRPEYMVVYKKMLRLPSFVELASHPALLDLTGKLLGGPVLVHPRRIGRLVFPNNLTATTPPHQDYFYIRGAVETYSIWMPLGECPITLGGLAILRGSHRDGFVEHTVHSAGAVGGWGVDPERDFSHLSRDWHTADYEPGDVLLFTSHTVHKALPNLSGNQLRLSTDNRYQRKGDEIDPGALGSHYGL